jgi:hypothetical protein
MIYAGHIFRIYAYIENETLARIDSTDFRVKIGKKKLAYMGSEKAPK